MAALLSRTLRARDNRAAKLTGRREAAKQRQTCPVKRLVGRPYFLPTKVK